MKAAKKTTQVIASFTTEMADWRIVSVNGKIYVENIFESEYTKWCRFSHWGQFSSASLAKIACLLCTEADNSDAASEALQALLAQNKGFKHL